MSYVNDGHWQYAPPPELARLYAEHVTVPTINPLHIAEDRDGIPPELSAKWDRTMEKYGL